MKTKRVHINYTVIIMLQLFLLASVSFGQMSQVQDNFVLDAVLKGQTIDSITNLIKDNYVFPDIADRMSEMLKSNYKNGAYDTITDPNIFAQVIADDLHKINNDKHLRVYFSPKIIHDMRSKTADSMSLMEKRFKEQLKYDNYGFQKVEKLKGNIGYLDFRMFAPVALAGETAASALTFLSNCDALIIDLRHNGGGEPSMIRFICSYFFGPDSVHLNDIYMRKGNKTEQFWTLKDIKGKRMTDVDIYVLTSNFTFSGAEEFTYDLKNLKRATIIGEVTGGGANPGDQMAANQYFIVFVPTGRAINPYTKTNWEGTGVQPDIEVPQDKALTVAMNEAVKKLLVRTTDEMRIDQLKWMQEDLDAQLNPYSPDASSLAKYAGVYVDRKITFDNGILYYERVNITPKKKMIPIKEDVFKIEGLDQFRAKFTKDADGNITGMVGLYDNGMTDTSPRTN